MFQLKAYIKKIIPIDIANFYPFLYAKEWKESNDIFLLMNEYFNADIQTAEKLIQDFESIHLQQILKTAISTTKYYRDIEVPGTNSNSLSKFPFLSKEIIRTKFDSLINNKLTRMKWFNFNTGGSTGEPLVFRMTRKCGLVDRIHHKYFFEQIGFRENDKLFALDGVTISKSNAMNNIFWDKLNSAELPYGSIHFSSHNFNEKNSIHYINKILHEKPSFLRGYPSFIADLASSIKQLDIKGFDFIKSILLTSETIFDFQINLIKEVFNTPVILQYGHSEMAIFAIQMPNEDSYWCSPFYGYTEVINPIGEHVKIGEIGEIVVTSYHNTAMPFIRYRTGDLAEYGGKFKGATILKNLQGRTQDFVLNTKNEKISITGLIFGRHYSAFKNIKKWQIKQTIPGEVTIYVVPGNDFNDNDKNELIDSFNDLASIRANVECVNEMLLTSRGKFKFVIHEH